LDLTPPVGSNTVNITPRGLRQCGELGHIVDPQFSPDSSSIYFYTQPGNFGLILRLQLHTRETSVVAHSVLPMEGMSFDVIAEGQYAGDLIVHGFGYLGSRLAIPILRQLLTDHATLPGERSISERAAGVIENLQGR
jgi:hypothetical protein